METPTYRPVRMELRYRTPLLIRPVVAADKSLLEQGFSKLSETSPHMRFLRTVNEPSDRDLHYFTEIGNSSHMAWITHQGRVPGTLLLAILSRSALDNGISSFVAFVLEANDRMLGIIRQMGAHTERNSDEALKVELRTQVDMEDYPDTALGRVFRDVTLQMGKTG